MALAGDVFSAREALELGLVDQVVAKGSSLAAARGPAATQMVKSLINAAEGEEIERPLEAIAGALAATTADLKEGIAAFRDKRKPKFSGK